MAKKLGIQTHLICLPDRNLSFLFHFSFKNKEENTILCQKLKLLEYYSIDSNNNIITQNISRIDNYSWTRRKSCCNNFVSDKGPQSTISSFYESTSKEVRKSGQCYSEKRCLLRSTKIPFEARFSSRRQLRVKRERRKKYTSFVFHFSPICELIFR